MQPTLEFIAQEFCTTIIHSHAIYIKQLEPAYQADGYSCMVSISMKIADLVMVIF